MSVLESLFSLPVFQDLGWTLIHCDLLDYPSFGSRVTSECVELRKGQRHDESGKSLGCRLAVAQTLHLGRSYLVEKQCNLLLGLR